LFKKILHANDGSESAFHALSLAIALAEQNQSELHMVCVEELPNLPEFIADVRDAKEAADRRYSDVLRRASAAAQERHVQLRTHVLVGHPVRDIVKLAAELEVELLVIGAVGHSELYERLIGSRADRSTQLAQCPVLVAK
jgi:nucleotide-binding universal stress UspA family protein